MSINTNSDMLDTNSQVGPNLGRRSVMMRRKKVLVREHFDGKIILE